jgi:hypothetical protein
MVKVVGNETTFFRKIHTLRKLSYSLTKIMLTYEHQMAGKGQCKQKPKMVAAGHWGKRQVRWEQVTLQRYAELEQMNAYIQPDLPGIRKTAIKYHPFVLTKRSVE